MVWVLDHSEARLGARLVLLALAEFAHDDGSKAYPKVETLMRRSGLSERAVQYALRRLIRDGEIEQTGTSPSGTIVYRVLMGAKSAPPGVQKATSELAPDPRTKNPSEPNGSAQKIVAYFIDKSRSDGSEPPKRITGQAAKLIGELVAEGFEPDQIRRGIDTLLERGLHPAALPSTVHAAGLRRAHAPPAQRITGWRWVRGTHGSTYVEDPVGTDSPPKGYT